MILTRLSSEALLIIFANLLFGILLTILTKFLFGIISKFSASFSSPAKIIIFSSHSSEIFSFHNFFSSCSVSSSKERLLGFSLNNLSNLYFFKMPRHNIIN